MRAMQQEYDLIILDQCGPPYDGLTPVFGGLGGSEWENILLAEGFAAQGYKVCIINSFRFPSRVNNVDYWSIDYLNQNPFKCKTLLVTRSANVPHEKIEFDNLRFWFTDLPNESMVANLGNWLCPGKPGLGICVSQFHCSTFPANWNFDFIYNMIPDWVYSYQGKLKNPNRYIYASAACKGLDATVDLWSQMKKNYFMKKAELGVCHPGYDKVDEKKLKDNKIVFLGSLPFTLLVEQMSQCQSLFYINTMPETFCISAVLAEVLCVTPQILVLQHPGALQEVLANPQMVFGDLELFQKNVFENAKMPPKLNPAKDYRVSSILPQWQKILKI